MFKKFSNIDLENNWYDTDFIKYFTGDKICSVKEPRQKDCNIQKKKNAVCE